MSESITIPAAMGNRVTVTINGTSYTYATGTAVTVPDAVASEIENLIAEWPVDNRTSAGDAEAALDTRIGALDTRLTALDDETTGAVPALDVRVTALEEAAESSSGGSGS